jgi:hypothetical protein
MRQIPDALPPLKPFLGDFKGRGWFFAIFGSFWTLVAFGFTYSSYWELVGAYRTSNYSVGEGTVEDFHPTPYERHQSEASASKRKNSVI